MCIVDRLAGDLAFGQHRQVGTAERPGRLGEEAPAARHRLLAGHGDAEIQELQTAVRDDRDDVRETAEFGECHDEPAVVASDGASPNGYPMASRAARDATLPTISLRDPLQADPVAGAVRIGAAADGQAAGGPFAAGDRGVVGPAVRAGQLPLLLQHQLAVDQAPAHRTSTLDAIDAPADRLAGAVPADPIAPFQRLPGHGVDPAAPRLPLSAQAANRPPRPAARRNSTRRPAR